LRLFNLSRESKKNLSQEEAAMLATNVLLATLVIPVAAEKASSEAYLEIDSTQEKLQRLAVLVCFLWPTD
jgi:translation initiation factor 3 subunit A